MKINPAVLLALLLSVSVMRTHAQGVAITADNTDPDPSAMLDNTTGSYNTSLGNNSGPSLSGIDSTATLGTDATATATDMVRICNVWVNSIGGQVGWTTVSDGRFKNDVTENVHGLDFILALRPVTYRLDREALNEYTGVNERHRMIAERDPEA